MIVATLQFLGPPLGTLLIAPLAAFIIVEALLRVESWFRHTFLVREIRRRDFLAPKYQDYINWVEDWSHPMFEYLPIGFRYFNNSNPIPGRVQNNSLGFRCDEFRGPASGELHVVLLGGSAAWGSGATTNHETIAGQLEQIFNADRRLLGRHRRATVFNLAQVNGYQTQDLLSALFFIPRLKPAIVISFTGWNELLANDAMTDPALEKFRVFYMEELEGWQPLKAGDNKFTMFKKSVGLIATDRFETARRFLHLTPRYTTYKRSAEESVRVGTKLFLEHLRNLENLSHGFQFKHVQFLQPHLYRKKYLTPDEQKIVDLYDRVRPVHGGVKTGEFLRHNNIYADILGTVMADPSYGTVADLSDLFRDETAHSFFTLVHMTDFGYRKVAEAIYETLVAHLHREGRPHEKNSGVDFGSSEEVRSTAAEKR